MKARNAVGKILVSVLNQKSINTDYLKKEW